MEIIVLMSTYNGEKYLREQIDSILAQKGVELSLLVRDDGSSDGTAGILDEYQDKGLLKWYTSGNIGATRSFFDLLYNSPEADYYSFADQDDYWREDKLAVAISKLKLAEAGKPAVYISAQEVVDEDLNFIFIHRRKGFNFTFGEAILKNPAAGCTMVYNNAMRRQIQKDKDREPQIPVMHDRWLYTVCLATDGILIFDPEPLIKYRQHGKNVVGTGRGVNHYVGKRINSFKHSPKRRRQTYARIILERCNEDITDPVKRELLRQVIDYPESFRNKIRLLRNKNFRMGSFGDSFTAIHKVLLNKF